jgi:formylmethanofuran dehydrogenase subunit C
MNGIRLILRDAPRLRLDLRGVLPEALAALSLAQIARLPLAHGRDFCVMADWFDIVTFDAAEPTLQLIGDLGRVDHIGWQMNAGRIEIDSTAGDGVGGAMRGGVIRVQGDAGAQAGCEMQGGELHITGHVGDYAASTLPGSMDGMRGGLLLVHGNAGARFADRMRRGTAIVLGDAGDGFASRLVAGTVVLGGRCGAHPAYGMRRGSLVLASPEAAAAFEVPPTFVPAQAEAAVFWQLLARDLARLAAAHAPASPLTDLPRRAISRHLGDLAVDGKGELIVVR